MTYKSREQQNCFVGQFSASFTRVQRWTCVETPRSSRLGNFSEGYGNRRYRHFNAAAECPLI
jgi:hypothetical protein